MAEILGTSGDDFLSGTVEDDIILGLEGDDLFSVMVVMIPFMAQRELISSLGGRATIF